MALRFALWYALPMLARFPSEAERTRRARLIELLDEGLVLVHLDARRSGVEVPANHAEDPALVLKLSRRFHLPEFEVGPLAVVAALSCAGERFRCVLPYDAIFAFSTQEQPLVDFYPESAPAELMERLESVDGEP